MTDEEILAGAMEVFNRSMQTGIPDASSQGEQPGNASTDPADSGNEGDYNQGGSQAAGESGQMPSENSTGTTPGSGQGGIPQSTSSGSSAPQGTTQSGSGAQSNSGSSSGRIPGTSGSGTGTGGAYGSVPGTLSGDSAAGTGSSTGQRTGASSAGVYVTGPADARQAGNLPQGTGQQGGINPDPSGRTIVVIGSGSGVLTEQERVGNLDRELDEQLGVFDGIILGRRQDVIAKTNEQGAGNIPVASGGAGTDAGIGSAPLLTASRDPNNMQTRGQLPTGASGDNRSGDYQNEPMANTNIPEDISDGTDDDIVARQLREAAMQEQDPELRDKLWDEYRKYKAGVQARR
jgi:hypothetical protein